MRACVHLFARVCINVLISGSKMTSLFSLNEMGNVYLVSCVDNASYYLQATETDHFLNQRMAWKKYMRLC